MRIRAGVRRVVALVAIGALGGFALAGSLTPPAGPVAPTPGPEPRIAISATNTPGDADSVFNITAPGSYYLTGNLTGVAAKHGIEITASGVTIDLMGFEVAGVTGSLDGIRATVVSLSGIEIRNGSVRGWADQGIDLYSTITTGCRVDRIRAFSNNENGILVGLNSVLTECIADNNGSNGFATQAGCTMTGCTARSNGFDGFNTGPGTSLLNCAASANSQAGFDTNGASTLLNCASYGNTQDGFELNSGDTASNCAAFQNLQDGFTTGGGGITIVHCCAYQNTMDGIRVAHDSSVIDNSCRINGFGTGDGAGIHATGSDNRIEGNNCADSDRGIDVDAGGNIVIRNTCAGNTSDWELAAGTVYGPILDRRALGSAQVTGFVAGSVMGTTDPHANFSY